MRLEQWPTKTLTIPLWSLSCAGPSAYFCCWNSPWFWLLCLPISCHCSSACVDFCWRYSSQDRPTKILNTLPWLLSCTDTLVCWNSPWWCSCEHFMTINACHVATLMLESGKQWQPEGIQVIGMSCKLAAYNYKGSLWMRLEYELVEPNRVCPSIHKVRIRHDTRSVVATWTNTSL